MIKPELFTLGFWYNGDSQGIYDNEYAKILESGNACQFYFKWKHWYLSGEGLEFLAKKFAETDTNKVNVPANDKIPLSEVKRKPKKIRPQPQTPPEVFTASNASTTVQFLLPPEVIEPFVDEDSPLYEDMQALIAERKDDLTEFAEEQLKDIIKTNDEYPPLGEIEQLAYKKEALETFNLDETDLSLTNYGDFEFWLDAFLDRIKTTLSSKGNEYTPNSSTFYALCRGADKAQLTVPQYIRALSAKHLVRWMNG